MLNKLSDSWKDNLVNDVHNKSRFYANIRGVEYPAVSGTPTYAAPTDHRSSGSANLTGGVMKYLVTLTQPFTIDCRIAPTAVTSHDFIQFHETESDYTKRLKLFSVVNSGTGHYYSCDWNETTSQIVSTNGYGTIVANDYIRLTFVFNNGTSYLYRNGKLISSGATSAIVTNKNWMTVDATNTIVDYIRIIPNFAATGQDVENNFEDVYNEEIFFPYNNQSTGFTRCQITKYVNGYNIDLPGEFKSTQAGLSINNISGEFSADQYAAFSPENGSYNGTAAQSYLSRKIPIWIESWQDNKINDIPNGVAGYWSMDDVPEIPDNPAGVAYLQDVWATTDGWTGWQTTQTVGGGALRATFTNVSGNVGKGINAYGKLVRARLRANTGFPIHLMGYPSGISISTYVMLTTDWQVVSFSGFAATDTHIQIYAPPTVAIGDWFEIDWLYVGDGSYSTPLLDNSGNGRHGTIYGATPVEGVSGKALSFDGVNDYVTFTPINAIVFSASIWFKVAASVTTGFFIAQGGMPGISGYKYIIAKRSNNTIRAIVTNSSDVAVNITTTGTNYADDKLHFAVLVADGSNLIFYIDGTLVGATPCIPLNATSTWGRIGSDSGASPVNGTIDEPVIFSRALSAQEVLDLYNTRLNRYNDAQEPSFETIFTGNIAANSFARSTNVGDFSRISVQADSIIADIAKRIFRTGRKFEDYYLARTTDTGTSLFHELVKLGTQKEVYNYATNASFENTTIGNSWSGTISRNNTHAFVGTYGGYINSATTVKTTVVTELTKYERFTFSVWAYSTSAINVTMQIRDMLATTPNGTTASVNSHAGKGWQLLTVTHDVVSSSSDRLECSIITTGTPALWLDAACLNYGDYKPMIAANTNDGTSAVSQRADGVLTAYQVCGAIGENVSYQHPWAVFAKDENAWEKLKQLSEASLARHLFVTPDGIIKLVTAATAPAYAIEDISNIAGISASTQGEQANKLKVSGVKITEKTDMRIWNLNDSNSLTGDTGAPSGSFQRTTGAGDYFPLLAEAPDGLECVYDKDVIEE